MQGVVTPIGIAQVVARNVAPLVGILFFHWSATNVLVLYFLDTLLSFGVLFAGLARSFATDPVDSVGGRIKGEITYLCVALVLCAFFAIPLGMPVGIVLGAGGFSFRAAFTDPSLLFGALWQSALALWSYVGLRRALETQSPTELRLKQRFGLVLMRWAAVLVVAYSGLGLIPGTVGVFLLVAAYVAASILAEIAPDLMLRGTPADDSAATQSSSGASRTQKRRH